VSSNGRSKADASSLGRHCECSDAALPPISRITPLADTVPGRTAFNHE
jgi:hypothetical protein